MLKPLSERKASVERSSAGCAPKLDAGCRRVGCFCRRRQDIRVGGRASNAGYQYTLQGDDTGELYEWAPKIAAALQNLPLLTDVNFDQQQKGLETDLVDRPGHRGAARAHRQPDRQHALRRLWPAPGIDDLQPRRTNTTS